MSVCCEVRPSCCLKLPRPSCEEIALRKTIAQLEDEKRGLEMLISGINSALSTGVLLPFGVPIASTRERGLLKGQKAGALRYIRNLEARIKEARYRRSAVWIQDAKQRIGCSYAS